MITNNQELFSHVQKLIEQLNTLGEVNNAADLKSSMSISSMPTEILGEIRISAKRILEESHNDLIKKNLYNFNFFISNCSSTNIIYQQK